MSKEGFSYPTPPEVAEQTAETSFLRTLSNTEQWLDQHNIPFRILGSLALHTYTGFPLTFNRENRVGFQKVPDIDLLIPRSKLSEVEEYRKDLLQRDVPVNLELFSTHIHIDFKPEEEQSYLTHKKLEVPVSSELFQPVTRYLKQTPIVTVPPQTLFHTFVVCGGTLRHKA